MMLWNTTSGLVLQCLYFVLLCIYIYIVTNIDEALLKAAQLREWSNA